MRDSEYRRTSSHSPHPSKKKKKKEPWLATEFLLTKHLQQRSRIHDILLINGALGFRKKPAPTVESLESS